MQRKEEPSLNSELFKEGYDEALYENTCEIEFCDCISVSLISAVLRKGRQCLLVLRFLRSRRDLESGWKSVSYS